MNNSKQSAELIIAEAYRHLSDTFHINTLGHWLLVLSELDVKEHSILSKFTGEVAEQYFLEHYRKEGQQELLKQ